MIHDRDAHDDVLRVLESEGPPDHVIFHCFSGDVEFALRCAERGYVLSFAGTVTFKNAQPTCGTPRPSSRSTSCWSRPMRRSWLRRPTAAGPTRRTSCR